MPVDVSIGGRWGIDVLNDLSHTISEAKHLATESARLATKSFNAASQADEMVASIARLNPAFVGKQVKRFFQSTQTHPNYRLFDHPQRPFEQMFPSSIELTPLKAPRIILDPMMRPLLVNSGLATADCLVATSALRNRIAIQTFL
jgi:hypothetical protein